jgi:hypothetical protein
MRTSPLAHSDLYRGFESLFLRDAVWNAEKARSNPRKLARNGRNFADLAHNPTDNISFFTDAFFHRNIEIRAELEEGGFSIVTQVPIEGLGSMARDIDSIWAEAHGRKVLLSLLERTEMIEEVSGSSFHIMTVGRRGE